MSNLGIIIGYLLAPLQLIAIMSGIQAVLDWHWLPSLLLACLSIPLGPVVGSFLGVGGAVAGWGIGVPLACLIFLGPFLLGLFLGRN